MLSGLFKKDKENYIVLFQQTDRLLTPEERQDIYQNIMDNARFPLRIPLDILSKIYLVKNPRIKTEKLKLIEDILIKKRLKGTCEGLIDCLKSGVVDHLTKQSIFKIIREVAADEDIEQLVTLLRMDEPETRKVAAEVLRGCSSMKTAKVLMDEIDKPPWSNKSEALNLLFDVGRVEAILVSKRIMEGNVETDKKHAIYLLEKLGSDEAVSVLNHSIDVIESPRLRLQIAHALEKIHTPATLKPLMKLLKDPKKEVTLVALNGLEALGDPKAIEEIQSLLEIQDLPIELKAIEVIGKIGNEDAITIIVPLMKDQNLRVRQFAVDALYSIAFNAQTNISKMLLGLMSDRDVNVRRCVADILSRIKDETIFDRMFEFLKDEDWWVREAIAETLAKIKDERVVPSAIKLLSDGNEGLRRYAIEILIGIKDHRAVEPIIKLLKDPDWWVRERAVEALGYLGDKKIVPLLISMLSIKELLYVSVKALGELRDPRAIKPLIDKLNESNSEVKVIILEALAKLDAASAIDQIKKMLIDPDKEVRNKARDVLRRFGAELGDALDASDRWWEKQNLSQLDSMLLELKVRGATDLLLVAKTPPLIRIHGELNLLSEQILTEESIWGMLTPILSKIQELTFLEQKDLDFSYEIPGEGRFRGNLYVQTLGLSAVFRLIPETIPSLKDINAPEILYEFSRFKQGLLLFTGPSSCGKTTTLAATVDLITQSRSEHIITVEDPIEYLYTSEKLSIVTQREVGRHTENFPSAVRSAMREDPDIIVVGEMRDHETISMAITAAETGHLVLATLHSVSAHKTLDRIIDIFPTGQQDQIRLMLSDSLRGVIAQQLVNRKDGKGRIAVYEILVITSAISNLIREGKIFQIPSNMTTGRQVGMQVMEQSLAELVKADLITPEEALAKALNPEVFMEYAGIG